MRVNKGLWLATVLLGASFAATADVAALNDAANKLCEKSKMCLQQEMAASEDLPPGMAAMVSGMIEELCNQYISIASVGEHHEIIEPATACLNSMASKSCDDLMNSDEETPACQRYEKIAEKYTGSGY